MTQAIVVPYCEDQNEPSVPFNSLIQLPEDPGERDLKLKQLFLKFHEDDEDIELDEVEVEPGGEYGDFDVHHKYSDYHLYITKVEEN